MNGVRCGQMQSKRRQMHIVRAIWLKCNDHELEHRRLFPSPITGPRPPSPAELGRIPAADACTLISPSAALSHLAASRVIAMALQKMALAGACVLALAILSVGPATLQGLGIHSARSTVALRSPTLQLATRAHGRP